MSASADRPPWASSVQWHRANVLNPDEYQQHLAGADAVVHSMGILLETDYKGVLQGKESPLSGLSRAFSASKRGSQNPLDRKPGEELTPQEKDGQLTYELMNRDSGKQKLYLLLFPVVVVVANTQSPTAILLAKESSTHRVPTFVYISAAAGAPVLPKRYITTKREAESTIASQFPTLRSVFIRAPFMWDSSRGFTLPIAAAGGVASLVNSAVGGRLTWLMGAGGVKPLKADLVGEAVVEAVEGGEAKGPVEVPEIEALATKHWRRNML